MKSPHVVLVQMECLVGRCGIDEAGARYEIADVEACLSFHNLPEDQRARLLAELGEPEKLQTFDRDRLTGAFTVATWPAAKPRRNFTVKAFGWPELALSK